MMNEYSKMKGIIRDVILSVDQEDRWNKADKVAGMILEALGHKDKVYYPHSNNEVSVG